MKSIRILLMLIKEEIRFKKINKYCSFLEKEGYEKEVLSILGKEIKRLKNIK